MKRRGFTLLEVMISLVVIGVGSAALFGLQGMVARSNQLARELTTANEILGTWLERLKTDAIYWTGTTGVDGTDLAGTQYLIDIVGNSNVWLTAGGNDNIGFLGQYPGFDRVGIDVDTTGSGNQSLIAFCVSYRLSWVVAHQLIRAEVRVFWPRNNIPTEATLPTAFPLCVGNQDLLGPTGAMLPYYHLLQASTLLRWNPQPAPP